MEYRKLGNTDMTVSCLSYGASALGGVFRDTNREEGIEVVKQALESGINYIDTAPWYGQGQSEAILGQALGEVSRDKYYIASKVGRYEKDPRKMFDFSAERTLRSVDESLARLRLSYVDVIQVHDMEFAKDISQIWKETLPALQKIKDSGKARYIGITGYPLENFRKVLEHSKVQIDTILTYCHYSMNDSSLTEHLSYFKEKGVGVINASPISMGLLSNRGPPEWHPAPQHIKNTCSQAANFCKDKGVDISRLALDFTLKNQGIPTTLVSTASLKNIKSNIEVAQKGLSTKETEVQQECYARFFKDLQPKTWENLEVQEYWKSLNDLKENS